MSEFGDLVQSKCDAFADRVVKLNDYLLKEAANQRADVRWLKAETRDEVRGKEADRSRVPAFLQSVSLRNEIIKRNIRSIAIPPLGSHNGGLDWLSSVDYLLENVPSLKNWRNDDACIVLDTLEHEIQGWSRRKEQMFPRNLLNNALEYIRYNANYKI